jgi:hypothetical protein
MPFLRAGFNGRHYSTGIRGWTRHIDGKSKFAPASLICFEAGDYAWRGARFLAWGECVVLGSHYGFDLPHECTYEPGLPHCDLDTREEHEGIDWARYR